VGAAWGSIIFFSAEDCASLFFALGVAPFCGCVDVGRFAPLVEPPSAFCAELGSDAWGSIIGSA
jgi:hypothetical protein